MLEAIAAIAVAQGALFNPPIDRAMRLVTEQVQQDAGGERRYRVERTLYFGRDGDGLFAELTLDAIVGDSGEDGARFEAGLAGLKGRMIRYRLNPTGKLRSIDGLDGHWRAFVDGIATGPGRAKPAPLAARAIAMLRETPLAQRQAMFRSMIEPLLLADFVAAPLYRNRPVSQTGRPPLGDGAVLAGTETLERLADGTLTLRRAVEGTHDTAPGGGDAATRVHRSRETRTAIDPRTGLLARSMEITRTRIGKAERMATTHISLSIRDSGN